MHDTVGWLAVPLVRTGSVTGLLLLQPPPGESYTDEQIAVAAILSGQAAIAIQNADLYQEMQRQAVTDELTRIFNRRKFMSVGERLMSDSTIRSIALVSFDVDHFKSINDTFGHACGDAVLRGLVSRCLDVLRPDDVFGRCGGEEFSVLLAADEGDAVGMAERMRAAVSAEPLPTDTALVPVTISLGVAVAAPGSSFSALMKAADAALYAAKHGGRDRVCSASSLPR